MFQKWFSQFMWQADKEFQWKITWKLVLHHLNWETFHNGLSLASCAYDEAIYGWVVCSRLKLPCLKILKVDVIIMLDETDP